MNNRFLLALSILVGTIIGGGIFALPYVFSQSGIVPALFYFILLGGVVILLHLFFGEVCLRTKEKARLIGYANRYLGSWGKGLATFSTLFWITGTLLAYIILAGDFFYIILGEIIPFSKIVFSLLFWALLSFFIVRGIQLIAKAELIMNIVLFAGIFLTFFFAAPHIQLKNFSLINTDNLFLPYGVILFALAGWPAIPEIVDFFKGKHEKRNIDNVIVIAGVIIIALYLAFSLFVVGVSGGATSPDALSGLIPLLGKGVIVLGSVFGLVAIAASFLILGNYLKNSLRYDFNLPYIFSAGIATIAPLLLFLIGFQEFILVLSIVGLIAVIDGVLIVALFLKVKGKGTREPEYELRIPRFIPYLVAIVLIGGAVVELLSFL